MAEPYERVYTVHDYYDGPRGGFADFGGVPHAYRSLWRDLEDDGEQDRYELSPVSREQMGIVMEDWAIWRRWESAFHAGRADACTHPALPADRARHEVLAPRVARLLEIDQERRHVATGAFRAAETREAGTPPRLLALEVRWTPLD